MFISTIPSVIPDDFLSISFLRNRRIIHIIITNITLTKSNTVISTLHNIN